MLRLQWESLSPSWSEFVVALFRDLEPLGHSLSEQDGTFMAEVCEAVTISNEDHWDRAHRICHQTILEQHREEILSFERDFDRLFVDMETFQPSAVRPILEVVDFKRPEHKRTVDYLRLMQSVTVRKLVGRRMGLLIWDVGQTGGTRLFGSAVLASARFSQRIRDQRFQWPPHYPQTSIKHDPMARVVRIAGLNRIMQLSMACVMPPYNVLSGAWLPPLLPLLLSALRRSEARTNRFQRTLIWRRSSQQREGALQALLFEAIASSSLHRQAPKPPPTLGGIFIPRCVRGPI